MNTDITYEPSLLVFHEVVGSGAGNKHPVNIRQVQSPTGKSKPHVRTEGLLGVRA